LWQHNGNKKSDRPNLPDNVSTTNNTCEITYANLFKMNSPESSGNKSASAAGGRASELIYCAAVDKIEEMRKPEDFIGHRKRGVQIPRSGISP
jgi:hypothetical protein